MPQFTPKPMKLQKAKSCKRIIKRDSSGKMKSEEFIGCSKEEVKMMKENSEDESDY